MTKVAVIGAGLIGRSWSIVFARAGFSVNLWDPFPRQTTAAMTFIAERLPELRQAGLLADEPDTVLARITPMPSMWETVQDVVHVQENGPEQVPRETGLVRANWIARRSPMSCWPARPAASPPARSPKR